MTTTTITPEQPCWICGHGPHAPTELHAYVTEREAREWFARQPRGSRPLLEVDGEVHSYTL
ncbi:MAG: hypothetical protein ACRDRO_23580 [Pseudonocardiaceae bacterium]